MFVLVALRTLEKSDCTSTTTILKLFTNQSEVGPLHARVMILQLALTRCPVNQVYMSSSDDPCIENPATFRTATFCPDVSSNVTVSSKERSATMSSTCRLSAIPTPSTCSTHLPRVCAFDRMCTVNKYTPSTGTTSRFIKKRKVK